MKEQNRLESWKEISSYLKRSIKTCQRWEIDLSLPIHRLDGTPSARVFAYPAELDGWMSEKLHYAEALEKEETPPHPAKKRRWVLAAGVFIGSAAIGILVWRLVPKPSLSFPDVNMPSLAFLPFENVTGDETLDLWVTALPQLLSIDFLQSRFVAISTLNDNLYALKKLKLLDQKKYSVENLRTIATTVGGEYMATGSLIRSGEDVIVGLILNDSKTGEPVHSFRIIARGETGLFAAIDELTRNIKIALNVPPQIISQDIDDDVSRITTGSIEALTLYCKGIRLGVEGKTTDAVSAFREATAVDPEFSEAFFQLFMATSALAECCGYDWAREEAARSGSKAFEYSERLNLWARGYLAAAFYLGFQRNVPRAIAEFEKLLSLMKDDPHAALQLAQIWWDLEEYDKVIALLEKVGMNEDPRNVQLLANSYMRTGAFAKAEKTFANLGQKVYGTCLFEQEVCALAQGKIDEALVFNDRIRASLKKPLYSTRYTRSPIFVAQDDLASAESEFRIMIEKGSKAEQAEGWLNLARLSLIQGRLGEARSQAGSAIALSESLTGDLPKERSHYLMAYLLRLSGDFSEAMVEAEEACRLVLTDDSLGLRSLHLRALISLDMGRMEEFEKHAEEVKHYVERMQYPKLMRAYYHLLGEREIRDKHYGQAIDYFWKAINLLPSPYGHHADIDSAWYYFSLAEGYDRAGQCRTALEMYEKVPFTWTQKLGSGDFYVRRFYLMGRAYDQCRRTTRGAGIRPEADKTMAMECFRKFLGLYRQADPDLASLVDDAKKRLAALEAE